MKVVVVGKGGREHALAYALHEYADVVVTPGNAGIPKSLSAPPEILEADLFVIGPEQPLVDGLADRLRAQGKAVFGPGADGARLEGSKVWMKGVLLQAGVPTAPYAVITDPRTAKRYLNRQGPPFVVKTDGLAGGKGTFVTMDRKEAIADARAKLSGHSFGDAGRTIVIEEGLTGPELSVTAICNGRAAVLLPSARDYKRLLDSNQGPNTGGMGAYSPVADSLPRDDLLQLIDQTLWALRRRDIDYRGVLYAGLMLTPDGPKMLEYNIRFGDPEAQVVLPRLTDGLLECLLQAAQGQEMAEPPVTTNAAVTITLASRGYGYQAGPISGDIISGIEDAESIGALTFHGDTTLDQAGSYRSNGGRVLYVTALASTVPRARSIAYAAAGLIRWPSKIYRSDIASDATT